MPCDWCVESPAIGRPSGPADFAALSPEMEALKVTPGAVPSEFGRGGSKVQSGRKIGTVYLPKSVDSQVPAEFHFPFLLFRAGFSKDRKQCPGREGVWE